MALSNPRRLPIPSSFLPPDWSPESTKSFLSSPLSFEGEIHETTSLESPVDLRFLTSSFRSTVAPPSDVFATSLPAPQAYRSTRKPLRSSIHELKARPAAIRRTKAIQPATTTSPLSQAHTLSDPPSTWSSPTPEDISGTLTAPPSIRFDTANLRSVKGTLRGIKRRQAPHRQARESQHTTTEHIMRSLAEQHKAKMVRICKIEEHAYEERWKRLWKRSENGEGTMKLMLRFCQVPWPTLPPVVNSPAEITIRGVERFLLSPFRKVNMTSKEKIQEELLCWEQGIFETQVLKIVEETQREDVRNGAEKVRKALESLLGQL